jgi:hypothetical protein
MILPRRANQLEVSGMITGVIARKATKFALRQKAIFARRFNVIARFKPARENISLFPKIKSGVCSAHPTAARGAYRDRHGRRQRDAMDAALHQTSVVAADGKGVWS